MGMLVLKRLPQQRIRIRAGGKEIWLTLVDAGGFLGRAARLGFESEEDVEIMREEVIKRVAPEEPSR